MESITIYPKNEKQKTLLKSLLEEMKVRFEIGTNDESFLNKKAELINALQKGEKSGFVDDFDRETFLENLHKKHASK